MCRLVAYCRVSSELQKDNTSLEYQRKRIEAYCFSAGHEIVGFYEDVQTASGKKFRPQFNAALDAIRDDHADGLACLKLDRFARNTMEGLRIAAELKQTQKQLIILDLNLDTSTAIGECIFTVLLSFAQLERAIIDERTDAGRRAVVEAGGYAFGRPPYGWNAVGKRLVPNEHEQAVRAMVFQWRAQGMTMHDIATELNNRDIPSKLGRKWHSRTICLMLTRDQFKLAHVMQQDC